MWGTGPYRPGGAGYSDDTFTYVSESWTPTNVSLVDTRTGQTLWSVEIPVGQQCVVRFYRGTEPDNEVYPDTMRWQLMPAGKESGELYNVAAVPPMSARRVDVSLRQGPEMPRRPEPAPIAGASARPARAASSRHSDTFTPLSPAADPVRPRERPVAEPEKPVRTEPEPARPAPLVPGRSKIPVP